MSLNSILLTCVLLLVLVWSLTYFRKPLADFFSRHPGVIKMAAIILLLALALFALVPFLIFLFG